MTELVADVGRNYAGTLSDYMVNPGEAGLLRAYELGREAMNAQLGVLDLANVHHHVLTEFFASNACPNLSLCVARAADFFAEAVSPFEMAFRGYREANDRLSVLNENLTAAQRAAEAATQAKSEFLANMSHEIRTPLNAVIGLADIVLETDMPTTQRELLHKISRSSNELLGILNDILDYSKIEAGRLDIEMVETDIEEVIAGVGDVFTAAAEEKHLGLYIDIMRDVPAKVMTDPLRTGQVLKNLVSNAIKFTEQGEIIVSVAVKRLSDGVTMLEFTVQDTGIGIPGDRHAEIFSPFTQADNSTTRRYGGTGLGLAIVSRIVEEHQGSVRVEENSPIGARFIVELPVAQTNGKQS